jgi:hypothetical protein
VVAITGDTRLNRVLHAIPGALDYIVALNPHDFERLRNPTLRRYMSSRISLRRVATMAGMTEERLVNDLTLLSTGQYPQTPVADSHAIDSPAAPDWMQHVDPARIQWVDVVPIDDVGGDPFPPISLAVKQLSPGGVLGIRHRWEPQPLYDIWTKMDLEWFARKVGDDEWYVFVHRPASVAAYATRDVVGAEVASLPAPEVLPRLQVLAEQLAKGQTLEASGLRGDRFAEVRDALGRQLGAEYVVAEAATQNGNTPVLRVTRKS